MNANEPEKYIQEKANNIPIPSRLLPDSVEKTLASVPQRDPRPFRIRRSLAAAAACLILLTAGLIAAGQHMFPVKKMYVRDPQEKMPASPPPASSPAPDAFGYENAYTAISGYYKDNRTGYYEYYEGDEKTAVKAKAEHTASEGSPDYSDTDLQVEGVMEGDIVKTDGQYLYQMQQTDAGSKVKIFSVKGKEVEKITDIKLKDRLIKEMYVEGNRLILINESWDGSFPRGFGENKTKAYVSSLTEIVIYDISNKQSIKRICTQTQSGDFSSSRISGGFLYTFSDYQTDYDSLKKDQPDTYVPQVNGKCMESDDVRCISRDNSNRYMVMTALPADGSRDFTDTLCALGGSDVYYVSDDNIYAARSTETWTDDGGFPDPDQTYTDIVKYSYRAGSFRFAAKQRVRGMINDSYYMHEYKDNLYYVYTCYKKNGTTSNGIVSLDSSLNKLGELNDLGVDERIYASYYIDSVAYFVTFRETDPVFAVDLSRPEKLNLLSELKLPGFSSYLHSFGSGLLLGVGEQTGSGSEGEDTAKLSVFSIKDDHGLKEICRKRLPHSQSYADGNHKSVFVDEERGIIGLGIENTDNYRVSYHVYSYADNKLTRLLSQTCQAYCEDLRGLRIGDYFYVVDSKKITAYQMPEAGQTKSMSAIN